MRQIVFPLVLEMGGSQVVDLQAVLQVLMDRGLILRDEEGMRLEMTEMLRREGAEQKFGSATEKLVGLFQESRQLATTGAVDKPTAEALNTLLREWGMLDQPPPSRAYVVSGQVLRDDGVSTHGLQVRAVHESDAGPVRLGDDMIDADGRYTIRYEPLPDSQTVALRVVVVDRKGSQLAASDVIASARPVEVIDVVVSATDSARFVVEGKVASRVRAGVQGLRISIVDQGIGGDLEIAVAVTDEGGAYRATFTGSILRQRGKQRPDLQARVFAGDQFLGASGVRYDATSHETIDVLLDGKQSAALSSEHETLTRALASHFDGKLGELREQDGRQEISYLANKTGWDARAVALASLADQFSARAAGALADAAISPPFFYALFRAGLPANDSSLYETDPRTAEAVWRRAIAEGVIPAELEPEVPAAVERFRRLVVDRILDIPPSAGLSSMREMLAVAGVEGEAQQRQFADLYVRHRGDLPGFWEDVKVTYGEPAAKRLRLDGQLGYLTLNNAPLIRKLHTLVETAERSDSRALVGLDFHRPARWSEVIANDPIPDTIPGRSDPERRGRYAEILAAQVRLSYPTAVVAQMVRTGDTPLLSGALADAVAGFLEEHDNTFAIGRQPVAQYVVQHGVEVAPEVVQEITRIQRVRQITPGDEAMNALLKSGLDSAAAVARYDRDDFVRVHTAELGGEQAARLIHAKAQQVHNATLNIALSYLTAARAPAIGLHSPAQIIAPAPHPTPAHAGDVIAYATLEGLLGEMDFCECEHCRSFLSPAAYLVDLLQFIDRDPVVEGTSNPQIVLFERRPDIQHLPLTCENTLTPLPYIDVVNETLEYYVANALSLDHYKGNTTDGIAGPEELAAAPQFVNDDAYKLLAGEPFPLPLPFDRDLESLRRYYERFDAPLPAVMEVLRTDDSFERPNEGAYGWRDILMEELRISRPEHRLLTDHAVTVRELYGYPAATSDADAAADLAKAKTFARRVGITYEELLAIVKTRFINRHSALIPRLERLGVPFSTLKAFKDGGLTDEQFDDLLAPGLDTGQYDGDIKAWVKNEANFARIMGLIRLTNPTGENDPCSFDEVELRYANPDSSVNELRQLEYVRLLRFIRLWKKLGWTIDQTDKAIAALYPFDQMPEDPDDAINLKRLDDGFRVLLPRLGIVRRVVAGLRLTLKKDLVPLLACFGPIDAHGEGSLYRQMFLSHTLANGDDAFADEGYGDYLTAKPLKKLLKYQEPLHGAFQLTADEFGLIADALGYDENTSLTLENISAIFRRGWLARKLKLSVRVFLSLTKFTGLDPFDDAVPPEPHILRFIELVEHLRSGALKPENALYVFWNDDPSGRSVPDPGDFTGFARDLRAAFAAVEAEFALVADPDGQIAHGRMAQVYGPAATELFFSLLDGTLVTGVAYDHHEPSLSPRIIKVARGQLVYDDFRKRLSFAGAMRQATRDALKGLPGVLAPFKAAVDDLYAKIQRDVAPLFERYPGLEPLLEAYLASAEPPETKRTALLASFLPDVTRRRKREVARVTFSSAAGVDLPLAAAILDDAGVLHAAADRTRPALDDMIALETRGLSLAISFADTASGSVGEPTVEADLDYSSGDHPLPPNTANPGDPVSGVWSGLLEAPANGFYSLEVRADPGATVSLSLGGTPVLSAPHGKDWRNANPIELHAGALYQIELKVEKVRNTLAVRWQTESGGWEAIPSRFLFPATSMDCMRAAYVRSLKAAALAAALRLAPAEFAYLAAHPDYRLADQGWLNSLPIGGVPDESTAEALQGVLDLLLGYARLKAALSPADERLLAVLRDPLTATKEKDSLLFILTRWERASLDALLVRFGADKRGVADRTALRDPRLLVRIFDALAYVRQVGIPAADLIAATGNAPTADTVRTLQLALRARYDETAWLQVQKAINDSMRALQRDALVAYILHRMRSDAKSAHIETPEKLFEYFLMDVQMEACTQTSRIRHALSSVQLFVERCLMNLESDVAPSALNAKQWTTWMSRYRPWEANRQVFLFPENWLEHGLRDDESPFFRETISELLQGDITDDRAATALVGYLGKLEEVAKLEPCGIHYVESEPGTADDIAHVVARTTGANHKYYYRRRERAGRWTPWELIGLDIEDAPVIPVLWGNRLFLFWLRLLKQAPLTKPSVPDAEAASTTAAEDTDAEGRPIRREADLAKMARTALSGSSTTINVQAVLCWSEYFNGKWQPARTSDINRPLTLGTHDASDPIGFDRSKLKMSVLFLKDAVKDAVRVIVSTEAGLGSSFFLYNAYSTPELRDTKKVRHFPPKRIAETATPSLKMSYPAAGAEHPILTNSLPHRVVEPNHPLESDPWTVPFFYEDARHAFYVTATERDVPFAGWDDLGPAYVKDHAALNIPPLVFEPVEMITDLVGPIPRQPGFGVVDPSPMKRFVTEDVYVHQGIATGGTVQFDGKEIGPAGSVVKSVRSRQGGGP